MVTIADQQSVFLRLYTSEISAGNSRGERLDILHRRLEQLGTSEALIGLACAMGLSAFQRRTRGQTVLDAPFVLM